MRSLSYNTPTRVIDLSEAPSQPQKVGVEQSWKKNIVAVRLVNAARWLRKLCNTCRGPVKNFHECVQTDAKGVEKLTKWASRVKYLRLVTLQLIAMWLSKWVQNLAVLPWLWRKVNPGFHHFAKEKKYNSCNDTFNNSLLYFRSGGDITPRISRKSGQILTRYFDIYSHIWSLLRTKGHEIKWIFIAWWIHDVMVSISYTAWCER